MLAIRPMQIISHQNWWFIAFSIGLLFKIAGRIDHLPSTNNTPELSILIYFFIATRSIFLGASLSHWLATSRVYDG
ncbi:hypothetical protein GGI43DRAFT_390894, partial [Trichoderma evansii]